MRSIDIRFNKFAKRLPTGASLTVFMEAVAGQGYCKQRLYNAFNRLVDKDDYDRTIKRQVLAYLGKVNSVRSV